MKYDACYIKKLRSKQRVDKLGHLCFRNVTKL